MVFSTTPVFSGIDIPQRIEMHPMQDQGVCVIGVIFFTVNKSFFIYQKGCSLAIFFSQPDHPVAPGIVVEKFNRGKPGTFTEYFFNPTPLV